MILQLLELSVSLPLNQYNFSTTIKEQKYVFVKFFSPTCQACVGFQPVWEQLEAKYKNKLTFGEVDCTDDFDLCSEQQVQGWPTLKLYKNGNYFLKYQKVRVLEALEDFLDENIAFK